MRGSERAVQPSIDAAVRGQQPSESGENDDAACAESVVRLGAAIG